MKLLPVLVVGSLLCLAAAFAPQAGLAAAHLSAAAAPSVTPQVYLPMVSSPPRAGTPTLNAISNASNASSYTVSWSTAANVTTYSLQEDDTNSFTSPTTVYSGSATQWAASGKAAGTWYYRVEGANTWTTSAWSNVVSTTVNDEITPNDPYYSYQWGPAKVNAPKAWYLSTGSNVTIAIVDTGVDLNHPDLASKILSGQHFYTDPTTYQPYQDTNVQDDNGHGTHVAGIAAAIGNNGIGVAGMAWNAKILPVKVLASNGSGYTSDIARGVTWAVNNGAKVINLSLGGEESGSTLTTATSYAYSQGALVVAAAGNCGDSNYARNGCTTQNPTFYPAANPNVVGVGATDSNDQIASFSESGSFVDVSAPGVSIYSTLWANGSTYGYESGTSMATPMVSGLAALVWSRNLSLTNAQVVSIIETTADDLGTTGRDNYYGYGRIDAGAAVAAAATSSAAAVTPAQAEPATLAAASTAAIASDSRPVRPGVVLVRMKPTVKAAAAAQALEQRGLQVASELAGLDIKVVSVPAGSERKTAAALQADAAVEFAEPDYQVSLVR